MLSPSVLEDDFCAAWIANLALVTELKSIARQEVHHPIPPPRRGLLSFSLLTATPSSFIDL